MGIGYCLTIHCPPALGTTPRLPPALIEFRFGTRFGPGTNNQAEYLSLIWAMRHALLSGVTHLSVRMDSLVVVNQVSGFWACRNIQLKALLAEAQGLTQLFTLFSISHIDREENTEADWLSRNPTVEEAPKPRPNGKGPVRRYSRHDAAMIRWWWKSYRCRNAARLGRLFCGNETCLVRMARGDTYKDLTEDDLYALPERSPAGEVPRVAEAGEDQQGSGGRVGQSE